MSGFGFDPTTGAPVFDPASNQLANNCAAPTPPVDFCGNTEIQCAACAANVTRFSISGFPKGPSGYCDQLNVSGTISWEFCPSEDNIYGAATVAPDGLENGNFQLSCSDGVWTVFTYMGTNVVYSVVGTATIATDANGCPVAGVYTLTGAPSGGNDDCTGTTGTLVLS